jgi:hypothetical protein
MLLWGIATALLPRLRSIMLVGIMGLVEAETRAGGVQSRVMEHIFAMRHSTVRCCVEFTRCLSVILSWNERWRGRKPSGILRLCFGMISEIGDLA